MFRIISIISFLVVLGGIGLHHLIFSSGYKNRFSLVSLLRKMVYLFTLLFLPQKLGPVGRLRNIAFLVALLSFCVLLLTGFGPLLLGCRLHGYLLMIHATFAPVFIACAAFIAITGAGQYAFNKGDAEQFPSPCWKLPKRADGCWLADTGIGAKAGFWMLIVMSLPVTLTMVLSMLPIFGPEGQGFLFNTHRWCALVFGLTAIVELYILIRIEVFKDTKTLH
ncbi:MAG: hypothetical protein ACYSUG_05765 [Planctomycetota bacterium]|jgi:hypothetical protein